MQRSVALRERGQLAVLLNRILHQARQSKDWHEPDQRNLRTWRQLVLGILVARTTRLLGLAQVLLPQRQAQTAKTLAIGLSFFLTKSTCPLATLTPTLLEATLREVDPADMTIILTITIVARLNTLHAPWLSGSSWRCSHRCVDTSGSRSTPIPGRA